MEKAWARIIKKNIKGKAMLYLEFFDILQNKTRQKSLKMTYTEARKLKAEKEIIPALLADMKSKAILGKSNLTLKYFIEKYLISKESLETYNEIIKKTEKIVAFFNEDMDITTISTLDCEDFLHSLKISNKTKRNYKNVLSGIFQSAMKARVINHNPCDLVELGKVVKEEIEPFSKDEVSQLIYSVKDEQLKNYLGIAFNTGARTGEILGLMERDLDFENKTITIQRQKTKGELKNRLKTDLSNRVIPMFDSVIPYLKNQIAIATNHKSIFLFSTKDGKSLYGSDSIRGSKKNGVWSKLLKECNLKYRSLYHTRHTFITHSLNSGMFKIMELAQIVGHSNPQMIFKTYARFIKGEQLKIDRNIDIFNESTYTNTYTNKKMVNVES